MLTDFTTKSLSFYSSPRTQKKKKQLKEAMVLIQQQIKKEERRPEEIRAIIKTNRTSREEVNRVRTGGRKQVTVLLNEKIFHFFP